VTERREDPQPEPGEVTPTPEAEAAPDVAGESTPGPAEQSSPDPAADTSPDPTAEPSAEELADARPARLRHAPRFGRFIGTAVALGLLIGLVLAIVIPPPQGVGLVLAWAYLGLPIALVLGLAAGIAAVVIDRRS
jgi:hypothetical protein